jgi:FKBP-type peptidyl-prolyl cis-trans isomerase SlyD
MDAGHQVGPETVVSIGYAVFDAEGERVGTSDEPLEVVFGYGQLLPELEQAIEGMSAGQSKTVRLRPEQAYGRRDPAAIVEVERDEFPPDVAPGDRFEAETETGDLIVLRVMEVMKDAVVVDTNHPLADQTVRFELEIRSVRPATDGELTAAAERLESGQNGSISPEPGLVSPRRLLEGGRRRYENGGGSGKPA